MKECTNDYFEEDIPENDLTDALERENAAILEIKLEMENEPEVSGIPETSTRKKLKRELEQEALARLEDSARTKEEFANVVTWWNRLDANRKRKERYHEIGRSDVPLEWGMSSDEIVIPAPIRHVFWKQILKGDFLDAIYDCPFEMHELVADVDISKAIFALKDVQKELLYQLAIKGYSCQLIAAFREQTDRNIRKIRDTMLMKLRKSFMQALQNRVDNPLSLTKQEQIFYDNYRSLITDKKNTKEQLQNAIMDFVTGYGLLGFMTALPTTPDFITYHAVYLPKNHFIKEESMTTEKYLSYFFPFDKIDFVKKGLESSWSTDDVQMMALIMTMKNKPQAVMMSFQKEYAERYDWLVTLFKDWAFTFMSSFLYYQDFDMLDDMQKQLYRQGMAAFSGIAPTYHMELLERPTIVWDFHSLLLGVQMMFSFMLTDEKSSLKVCKHCGKAFVAGRPNSVFCSGRCKNQYNVYKSRAKNKGSND